MQLGGGAKVVDVLESAAFAQDFVELDLHLHVHPEDGRVGVLDAHTKESLGLPPGSFVLGWTLSQVARHRRFGSALTAEGAGTIGGKPAHGAHSTLVLRGRVNGLRTTFRLCPWGGIVVSRRRLRTTARSRSESRKPAPARSWRP